MTYEDYSSCIAACNKCAVECSHCAHACLQEDDVKPMARCIALDVDCANICRTAAASMAAESEFAGEVCRLCAEVCRTCGADCRQHDMAHCQRCADACERCADECERMAVALTA